MLLLHTRTHTLFLLIIIIIIIIINILGQTRQSWQRRARLASLIIKGGRHFDHSAFDEGTHLPFSLLALALIILFLIILSLSLSYVFPPWPSSSQDGWMNTRSFLQAFALLLARRLPPSPHHHLVGPPPAKKVLQQEHTHTHTHTHTNCLLLAAVRL